MKKVAIFGISKNKKKEREPKKSPEKQEELKAMPEKEEKKAVYTSSKAKSPGKYSGILVAPHVTEKATNLIDNNQYVFRVLQSANKTEVKKAVEDIYGVKVVNVKIIRIPGKEKRVGKNLGWKKGYKKAIVRIKKGQKIEVLPK